MGKIYAFLLGVAAGFGLHHAALNYHVFRTASGFHLTPKVSATLSDTYVDLRGFTAADAAERPAVAAAIAASGDASLLQTVAEEAIQGGVGQAVDLLNGQ